jgi:hypothetical protein
MTDRSALAPPEDVRRDPVLVEPITVAGELCVGEMLEQRIHAAGAREHGGWRRRHADSALSPASTAFGILGCERAAALGPTCFPLILV